MLNQDPYFPSGVTMACVTIAPRGLSASLAINLPIRRSHTPTQFRVTVTPRLKSLERLKKNVLSTYIPYVFATTIPYSVHLKLMAVDNVNLFKNIIDIPYFNCTIDRRSHYTIPIPNSQSFQLNDASEMCVQYFDQLPTFHTPYV